MMSELLRVFSPLNSFWSTNCSWTVYFILSDLSFEATKLTLALLVDFWFRAINDCMLMKLKQHQYISQELVLNGLNWLFLESMVGAAWPF